MAADRQEGLWAGEISIGDALDGALCFGWIDGQRRGLDDVSFLQRYCPRRPRSSWSQVNVEKVDRLTAQGRMRPAGLAEVEAAQGRRPMGRGVRVAAHRRAPDDLAAALAADPPPGGVRRARSQRAVRRDAAHPEGDHAAGARQVARAVEGLSGR